MANDYWNNLVALVRRTEARAEAVNSIHAAIKAGFDLLPSKARLYEDRVSYSVDSGAVNAYVITPPYAITLTDGASVTFKPLVTNTAASVANVYALGNVAVCDYGGNALSGGEMVQGAFITLRYNLASAHWRITNPLTAVASVTTFDINALTALTAPDDADYVPVQDTSVADKRKVTLQNFMIVGYSVAAAVDPAADYVLIFDASANALKKTLVTSIADEGQLSLAAGLYGL